MENTEASRGARPRRSLKECMLGFDNLERQTYGKYTTELSSLKNLLTTLTPRLMEVSSNQAIILTGQTCHKMFAEARNPSSNGARPPGYGLIPAFAAKVTGALKDKVESNYSRTLDLEKETETLLEKVRDELAEQILNTMETMWAKRSTEPENELDEDKHFREEVAATLQYLRNDRDRLQEKLGEAMEKLRNKAAAAGGSIAEKEKALDNKSRELEKSYYNKVQNLVEERLRDEKVKLADRLSRAETKALQYTKVFNEKKALEAKLLQEDREKTLLKQAKLHADQKYKDRDDEAKALREGYDQLSHVNQVLHTEKTVLQADYDELKREQERLSEKKSMSSKLGYVDQPASSSPHLSATTAFDRQTAERQHLGGVAAIWQVTLVNTTAKSEESRNRKEALEGKIQEAEQQLKKLKPTPPSKPHRGTDTQSTPKNTRVETQVVMDGTSNGQGALQSSVRTLETLQRPRVAAEAFPALSSPAVSKTTPSKVLKSLRLVDVPKKQTPDA